MFDPVDRLTCPHCWNRAKLAAGRPISRLSSAYPSIRLPSLSPDRIEAMIAPSTSLRR